MPVRKNGSGSFAPMLFPNELTTIDDIVIPDAPNYLMYSYKLDGIRMIFHDGEIYSRHMKKFKNKKLMEYFKDIVKYSKDNFGVYLDGEFYSHDLSFQQLQGITNSLNADIPEGVEFNCFDVFHFYSGSEQDAFSRYLECCSIENEHFAHFVVVKQNLTIEDKEKAKKQIEWALEDAYALGYEGLILKRGDSIYKYGRIRIKSGMGYKLKKWTTWDAIATDVIQSTVVDPKAEKKTDELGHSVTSKKKGDRLLVDSASSFVVRFNNKEQKVSLSSLTDEECKQVWIDRDRYKKEGRWIEFRGMEEGMIEDGLARFPTFVRFRSDFGGDKE